MFSDEPSHEATFVRRIFSAMNVRQEILARPAPVLLVELIQYIVHNEGYRDTGKCAQIFDAY